MWRGVLHDVGLDPREVGALLVSSDLLNRPTLVCAHGRRDVTITQVNWEFLSVLVGLQPIAAMALAVDELVSGGDPEAAVRRLWTHLEPAELHPIGARFVRRPSPKHVAVRLESLTWERWPAVLRGTLMRNPGAGAFLVVAAAAVTTEHWRRSERAALAHALLALAPAVRVPGRAAAHGLRAAE
jgi:hypothetical protein